MALTIMEVKKLEEKWKTVKGYEDCYEVSNHGNVRSKRTKHLRKPQNNGNGYLFLVLSKNGKHKNKYIHRLVAESFLPNPNNLPQINHKDENPLNNNVENLEWCTPSYNSNYMNHGKHISIGSHTGRKIKACRINGMKTAKKVIQMDLKGNVIKIWNSMGEAAREGNFNRCNIRQCCIGNCKQHHGYKWQFA